MALPQDTIPAVACAAASTYADAPAVVDDGRTVTSAEYVEQTEAVARGQRARGVQRGGQIAVVNDALRSRLMGRR